jgi:hypothetical protein
MRIDEAPIIGPCDEDDRAMRKVGVDLFCDRCQHEVIDLSARTEVEARAILARPGKKCLRYRAKKATGELLFASALLTSGLAISAPAFAAGEIPALTVPVEEPVPDAPVDSDASTPPCGTVPADQTAAADPNGVDPNATAPEVDLLADPAVPVDPPEPEPEPTIIYLGRGG